MTNPTTTTTADLAKDLIISAGSVTKLDESMWDKTGNLIFSSKCLKSDDLKGMQKGFYLALECGSGEVPERGENRKGETIPLRKDDGSVKWSAWKVTARICQNTNEILKCVDSYDESTVFPSGKLIPRHQVVQLNKDAKKPEDSIKTIERAVKMIEQKIMDVPKEQKSDLDALIRKVINGYSEWQLG